MTQYFLHTVELPKETVTSVLRVGDDGVAAVGERSVLVRQ